MKIGSTVICITSFHSLRERWGINYPYSGDMLTVSEISNVNDLVMLRFLERPDLPELSWYTINGEYNFIEVAYKHDVIKEVFYKESDKV